MRIADYTAQGDETVLHIDERQKGEDWHLIVTSLFPAQGKYWTRIIVSSTEFSSYGATPEEADYAHEKALAIYS